VEYAKKIVNIVILLLDAKLARISSIKNALRKKVNYPRMKQNINALIASRKVFRIIIRVLII
jgi:hypothetical protein